LQVHGELAQLSVLQKTLTATPLLLRILHIFHHNLL
jgi:hypothetical protein